MLCSDTYLAPSPKKALSLSKPPFPSLAFLLGVCTYEREVLVDSIPHSLSAIVHCVFLDEVLHGYLIGEYIREHLRMEAGDSEVRKAIRLGRRVTMKINLPTLLQ